MKHYKIPFVKLATEKKRELLPSVFKEIQALFDSSQFILGEPVEKFEKKMADLMGVKFAVGVNSGVDALLLSLRALGIGSGDEVITTPNSFLGSAAAIHLTGAKPVFVDVDWDFNINPSLIENAITPRTKAIMPVHLTGTPCRMDRLLEISEKCNLPLVEDAAQAIGAAFNGKKVGSFGALGCFSLHPLKNLHVMGDGGFVTTDSPVLAEKLRLQRNHGLQDRDHSVFFSYNSRLDTLQAIVGLAFFELLNETTLARRENAAFYSKRLSGISPALLIPGERENTYSVYHVYQVWTERRDELRQFLEDAGIETKIHYPVPIHLQEAAKHLGYQKGSFPVTEKLAAGILSLPVRESLERDELHLIVSKMEEFFARSPEILK